MVFLIIIATIAVAVSTGVMDAAFQSISGLTGTGFSSVGFIRGPGWNSFQKGVLTALMVVGGYG